MPTPPAAGASPVMAQWFAVKAAHEDALVFFRMGDFYELFFADAETAAAALDIALTARGTHAGAPIPMCGVPAANAEPYLARLLRRGFRVALVEQLPGPAAPGRAGKAPLPRGVVRLLSPATVTDEALLEAGRASLLLALAHAGGRLGAAWLEVSTGRFETAALGRSELPALLARLDPAEVLAPPGFDLGEFAGVRGPALPDPPEAEARARLAEAFGVASLAAFGSFSAAEALAAWRALDYLRRSEAGRLPRLSRPEPQGEGSVLAMDAATRASLELLRARDGGEPGSLLGAIRRTVSGAGGRMLAAHLAAPLTDARAIGERQEAWLWFAADPATAAEVRAALKSAPDLARALARLSLARFTPRDLAAVRDALALAGRCGQRLAGALPALLERARAALAVPPGLGPRLRAALAEPVPPRIEDGGVIAPGFDAALDEARSLRDDSRRAVAALQAAYAARFGVSGLRIRHHAQLGYVIEVAAAAAERLRGEPDLVFRQGLAGAARFGSAELAELDRRIGEAGERAAAREKALAEELARAVLAHAPALAALAEALALLDLAQGAAALAASGEWCRPAVTAGLEFRVLAGRHPVVEAALAGRARFVPNDCDLSPSRRLALLTGPNMAGKSTYLRQNALIVVLAQAGLPVPAREAGIGIVDRLFSRVGAADDLARGQSTFMVEMTETAAILHQAGPRSLIVVDEIGRGTATLDGLAIAWAVLEALHHQIRARTLFATHFHELARLGPELPRLALHTMRVKEWKGGVVFLHEVAAGAAGRSFGVHVAQLAGVPAPVVRRAAALLGLLERQGALSVAGELPLFAAAAGGAEASPAPADPPRAGVSTPPARVDPLRERVDPLRERLAALDPDRLTARAALEILYDLRAMLGGSESADPVESP